VSTPEEQIVEIAGVPGLPDGSYVILRVTPDGVELRLEVDGEMAAKCGEPTEPAKALPQVVALSPAALFDPEGRPRFRTKYTKGC
jgi:hypothetical protein